MKICATDGSYRGNKYTLTVIILRLHKPYFNNILCIIFSEIFYFYDTVRLFNFNSKKIAPAVTDLVLASISVVVLKADKLSHFCSLEAESFLWRVLVARWSGFVSEVCVDDFFFFFF